MKRVSVVVPVYNMEVYLPRCMNTLLTQTTNDMEIILIDDGSKDNSGVMCDEYAIQHPDLVRAVHKENGGLSSARNAGIDVAQGEYVIFPDPDDWVEPDYVEKLLQIYDKYSPDLACIGHFVDYESGECVKANKSAVFQILGRDASHKALMSSPYIGGFAWNKLYKLSIIREHCLRFLDDVGTTEDMDFAYRYLKYCDKVCFDPESRMYHYFQRGDSATLCGFSMGNFNSIRTYQKIIEDRPDNKELMSVAKQQICNTAINLICAYKKEKIDNKQVYKDLRKYLRSNLKEYLKGNEFGVGRKLQGVMALILPSVYAKIK